MTDFTALRAHLVAVRNGALADLATGEHLSPGLMRLATDADACLMAIDRAVVPRDVPAGGRIVVTHPGPGEPITVTIYRGADVLGWMELSPAQALAVGASLIQATKDELT